MARQPGEEKILSKKSKKTVQMGLALEKPNDEQEKKIINNNQNLKVVKNGGDMAGLTRKDLDDALKNALTQFATSADFKLAVQEATKHLVTEEKAKVIIGESIISNKLATKSDIEGLEKSFNSSIKDSASSTKLQIILWLLGGVATVSSLVFGILKYFG